MGKAVEAAGGCSAHTGSDEASEATPPAAAADLRNARRLSGPPFPPRGSAMMTALPRMYLPLADRNDATPEHAPAQRCNLRPTVSLWRGRPEMVNLILPARSATRTRAQVDL